MTWEELEKAITDLGEGCTPSKLELVVRDFYREHIDDFTSAQSAIWTSELLEGFTGFDFWNGNTKETILHRYYVHTFSDCTKWMNDQYEQINSINDRTRLIQELKSLTSPNL